MSSLDPYEWQPRMPAWRLYQLEAADGAQVICRAESAVAAYWYGTHMAESLATYLVELCLLEPTVVPMEYSPGDPLERPSTATVLWSVGAPLGQLIEYDRAVASGNA